MVKYFTKNDTGTWVEFNGYVDWTQAPSSPTIVALNDEDGPIKTGLFNAEGVALYRMPERQQMGFDISVKKKF